MLMQPVQGRERHEILKKRERERENMFTALSAGMELNMISD